jgi:triacylglycerol lipase
MASWVDTRSIILPYVSEAMQKYPEHEVTLVGHSLGGAVAALAGLEMRLKGWNPQITTFGEPMLGNADFAQFFDEEFDLQPTGSNSISSQEENRLRRVTHVNDPVPLLPLEEWGYEPHGGEIFISNPDLPPSLGDVHSCVGNRDLGCIAGSKAPALLREMHHDINIPINLSTSRMDPCRMTPGYSASEAGEQVVLGQRRSQDTASLKTGQSEDRLLPLRWNWSLIPAKYRLWELFYAHRDYFWRIGLCVPGGDPTV